MDDKVRHRKYSKDKSVFDQFMPYSDYPTNANREKRNPIAQSKGISYRDYSTNENRDKKKDKTEVAQPEVLRADSGVSFAMMKTNENRERRNPIVQLKSISYRDYLTNENRDKKKDKTEVAQPEDLRADSGVSFAMMKTNENREKEKDKTEVAQPEVEGFDESFNPNDRNYLGNPSIIALNPDDELEYWKHWEAYEKKNENREKDKKEVEQPEVEGLDESFDPNDRKTNISFQ